MRLSNRIRVVINLVILGISILAWVLLLTNPGQIMSVEHCQISDSGPSLEAIEMIVQMNPLLSQLTGWTLMVIAMMLPKLILPIQHIYSTSLNRTRFTSALLFVSGYVFVWVVIGIFMIAVTFGLHVLTPASYLPVIVFSVIVIIWQFSPIKQRFLNYGHIHKVLPAFGLATFQCAFLYGVTHGIWCVGAGWALMLLPMIFPSGHNLAMIIVTFIMISEHLEHPKIPSWGLNFRSKLFRLISARIQIRFKYLFNIELVL